MTFNEPVDAYGSLYWLQWSTKPLASHAALMQNRFITFIIHILTDVRSHIFQLAGITSALGVCLRSFCSILSPNTCFYETEAEFTDYCINTQPGESWLSLEWFHLNHTGKQFKSTNWLRCYKYCQHKRRHRPRWV